MCSAKTDAYSNYHQFCHRLATAAEAGIRENVNGNTKKWRRSSSEQNAGLTKPQPPVTFRLDTKYCFY